MLSVILNGRRAEFAPGTTILSACRALDIKLPTLCHDDRLRPSGACRLCCVEITGWDRFATACNTALAAGMEIRTHSPAVEEARRSLLELLLTECHRAPGAGEPSATGPASPGSGPGDAGEKEFVRWLKHYRLWPPPPLAGAPAPAGGASGLRPPARARFQDASHPYLHVDMTRCITCFRCVRICEEVEGRSIWSAWDRGDATTIRPARGTTLAGSGCSSCGACADTCPTGALEDQSVLRQGPPRAWTRTTCPYCGTGCELWVGTRSERIVQIRPVLDAPVSLGHLCVKGRYAFDFVRAPDRVTDPLIRDGRGGDWRRATWPEAIGRVAEEFGRLRREHGPDSLGVLGSARATNEENYLTQKFARVVLGTNNVDCCARVCHAPTAAGMKRMLGVGAATNTFADIESARGFLLCGCNPTESHPVVGARIRRAVRGGAKLVVIDPRVTELAACAEVHLQLRPGTNVALLNALAHVIAEEGLADAPFLNRRVAGFEEFRSFVRAWSPERAAAVTGVPAEAIRAAARLYASMRPAMCFHGLGVTEHQQGTDGVMCLVNLALLTGNLGRPGSGVNPLRGQNNVQGAAHMGCDPLYLPGAAPLEAGRQRAEAAWGAPLPSGRGLNLVEMLEAAGRGSLRGLWAIGYDVALTQANASATLASLGALEFVVVQDLFLNEMARQFADVFLPACSSFEKEGTFMNSERRVQRVRRALPPPGQARPDAEIICDVARAMGAADAFAFPDAEAVWNEVRSLWPDGAGLSYARLERGGLTWPCPSEDHPGTAILHQAPGDDATRVTLQRIDFVPSREAVSAEFPFLLTTGRSLYQFNAGTMTGRTPNAGLGSADTLDLSPEDAARLALQTGERVRVQSRHGEVELPVRIDPSVRAGELFATFHSPTIFLNRLTGPGRDEDVLTPEYKVTAVRLLPPSKDVRPGTVV